VAPGTVVLRHVNGVDGRLQGGPDSGRHYAGGQAVRSSIKGGKSQPINPNPKTLAQRTNITPSTVVTHSRFTIISAGFLSAACQQGIYKYLKHIYL